MYRSEIGRLTPGAVERLSGMWEQYPDLVRWEQAFAGVVSGNVRRLDYLAQCLKNVGKPKPRKPGGRSTIMEKPPAAVVDDETRDRLSTLLDKHRAWRAACETAKEQSKAQPPREEFYTSHQDEEKRHDISIPTPVTEL